MYNTCIYVHINMISPWKSRGPGRSGAPRIQPRHRVAMQQPHGRLGIQEAHEFQGHVVDDPGGTNLATSPGGNHGEKSWEKKGKMGKKHGESVKNQKTCWSLGGTFRKLIGCGGFLNPWNMLEHGGVTDGILWLPWGKRARTCGNLIVWRGTWYVYIYIYVHM